MTPGTDWTWALPHPIDLVFFGLGMFFGACFAVVVLCAVMIAGSSERARDIEQRERRRQQWEDVDWEHLEQQFQSDDPSV